MKFIFLMDPAKVRVLPAFTLLSVSYPYSSNPDPAKNLNPDPIYFLPLSEKKIYFIIIRFIVKRSRLKDNVVKVTNKVDKK